MRFASLLIWMATLFLLLTICRGSAVAQIDNDPINDNQVDGDVLPLLPGIAVSNRATLIATPGGDVDFFPVQLAVDDVVLGMTTPVANLPSDFLDPDTIASVFAFGVQATFSDDDDADELPSEVGNTASLFRFQAPTDSTYYVGITGIGDQEVDGAASGGTHEETGNYIYTVGVVTPSVLGGGFTDTDPANNTRSGADTIPGGPGAHVAVNVLDEDVDFFRMTLTAGQVVSAMTAPLAALPESFDFPDTLLGLFDSSGELLVDNQDAGDEGFSDLNPDLGSDSPMISELIFGSAIRAAIPSDGVYYLGVTGFDDDNFTGNHGEFGTYALLVGVANVDDGPEPLPGDFNADSTVDGADYVVWRKGDGTIYDQDDYNDWRANFGRSNDGLGASAAVPEPTTAAAILAGIALSVLLNRKRL
jgi:hypothetical protein